MPAEDPANPRTGKLTKDGAKCYETAVTSVFEGFSKEGRYGER